MLRPVGPWRALESRTHRRRELKAPHARAVGGWRPLLAATVLALVGGTVWAGMSERLSERRARGFGASAAAGLAALPAAARGPISRALGAEDSAYWASVSVGAFIAASRPQGLDARFDRSGVLVKSGPVRLGLQLQ